MTHRSLVPCTTCQRHIRVDEASCPFCGGGGPKEVPVSRAVTGRMTSLMVLTFRAAAVSAAVTACGGDVEGPGSPTSTGGTSGQGGTTSGQGGTGSVQGSGSDTSAGGAISTGGQSAGGSGGATDPAATGGDMNWGGVTSIYRATPAG